MSPLDRPLAGELRIHDLAEERDNTAAAPCGAGRMARTLVKEGPLRVTLVVVEPGGEIAEHHAPGPITVQPLDGRLAFTALGATHEIGPGQLLSLGSGIRHALSSADGCSFLLTHGQPAADAGGGSSGSSPNH